MIEIKVNDEVRDVEAQVWLGLSMRQIILLAVGLAFGIGVGYFLYFYTPIAIFLIGYSCIFTVTPFVLLAFVRWHELSPISALKIFLKKFMEPKHKEFYEPNTEYLLMQEKKNDKPKKINRKRDKNEKER